MGMSKDLWTAADGFSGTQGANQWRYERPISEALVWANDRWQEAADTDYPCIDRGVMCPGLVSNRAHDAMLRWDAPDAGAIRITGSVAKSVATQSGVRVRITKNHTKIWPPGGTMADAWCALEGDGACAHDLVVSVNAGDQIRFVVNTDGSSAPGDGVLWNPTIQVTEPQPPAEPAAPPAPVPPTEVDGVKTFTPTASDEVLINPDKGWIAYESEGDICKGGGIPDYLAEVAVAGDTLADVPVSDIYTRISWACFESGGEGVYDWSWLDRVFARYEGTGRTFSLRVAAFGYWGPTPPDLCYAVPRWVEAAGAQGEFVFGNQWRPVANDPVFLEKLAQFMNALGERYGGRDDISYIDLGSLGRWGEGHSHDYDFATFKKHWEILENAFPGCQLVVNDDMGPECYDWALDEKGAWIRDDSPYRWDQYSFPCMRAARLDRPNIMESRHIREWQSHEDLPNPPWEMIKEDLDTVLSCPSAPVSYAGIHHYPRDFMNNMGRDWVEAWANKVGYWFTVKQVTLPSPLVSGAENTLEFQVENRGVDIVHRNYRLALALTRVGATFPAYQDVALVSDARAWLQGQTTTQSYTWALGDLPEGDYYVDIALVAPEGDDLSAVVKLGNHGRLADEYLRLGTVGVAQR
jgi:hypothetical protein